MIASGNCSQMAKANDATDSARIGWAFLSQVSDSDLDASRPAYVRAPSLV